MEYKRKHRTTITKDIINLINNHIDSGKSNKEISEALNIFYNTVRNIGNRLTAGENDASIVKKRRRKHSSKNAINSQIIGIVENNNALTQEGIAE